MWSSVDLMAPEPSSKERRALMELAREIDPKSGEACEGIIECTDEELAQALYHTLIAKGYDTGGRAASIIAWYEESGFMEDDWDRSKQNYYVLRRGETWSVRKVRGDCEYICDWPAYYCDMELTKKVCFAENDATVKQLVESIPKEELERHQKLLEWQRRTNRCEESQEK